MRTWLINISNFLYTQNLIEVRYILCIIILYAKRYRHITQLARKEMDVNEHERLFSFALWHKLRNETTICIGDL